MRPDLHTSTLHASHILHAIAGSPSSEDAEPHDGLCRMCSMPMQRGQEFSRWSGSSFTDQNKVRRHDATHVCEACIWVHAWVAPPGYSGDVREGGRGPCLRVYSHLWHDGEYRYFSKGDKPAIREWLRAPKSGPWFACIADSGQKHLLPYTPVNLGGRGPALVRFEEETITLDPLRFWRLFDAISALLNEGVTKAEIEGGDYRPKFLGALMEPIREFERAYGGVRQWAGFRLALWLAQRDEEAYAARAAAKAGRPDRGGDTRDAKRVSAKRSKPAKGVGPDPGPGAVGNPDERRGQGLGDKPCPQPQLAIAEQGSLFGD